MNHAVDRIASRQHSLITTGQLRSAGFTMRQVARCRKQGALERLRRGVYRLAGGPVSWSQAIHAAVLAAGADAVVSHGTAAALWQLRHSHRYADGLHLTAHHQLRIPGVIGHTISLGPGETTEHQGVPTTSPERTLIDLAGTLSMRELGECLDDAIRRQLVNLERLRRLVASASARGGRRLLKPLHRLLAERLPGYRPGSNDWERDMDRLWDQLGLERGERQHRAKVNGRTYIIDRAIPALKIGAEYNGHEHHHLRSDRDHDAQRAAELSADGWHIIVFTSSTRPETLRRAISRIVQDRKRWMTISEPDNDPPSMESLASAAS